MALFARGRMGRLLSVIVIRLSFRRATVQHTNRRRSIILAIRHDTKRYKHLKCVQKLRNNQRSLSH